MLKRYVFKLSLSGLLLLGGCTVFVGADGEDGVPRLAIDWVEEPAYYIDQNPSIPNDFERGQFYQTEPGSYQFEYGFEDEFGWAGIYTIKKAEPGSEGSFFREDGEDGTDSYYTLKLSYDGTDFTTGDESVRVTGNGKFKISVKAEKIVWDSTKVDKSKLKFQED